MSPGGWDGEGRLSPRLDPGVEAHGHAVEEVGQEEAGRFIPDNHRVGDGQDKNDDTHQVAETIPVTEKNQQFIQLNFYFDYCS